MLTKKVINVLNRYFLFYFDMDFTQNLSKQVSNLTCI